MVTCLSDRMVTLTMEGVTLSLLTQMGTRLRRRPWLKRLLRSLSPVMSRLSCYNSWWPTLLTVAMGREMVPLQHRLQTMTLRSLTRHSSSRQESLSRPITGFR
jgi:hypothetical protein